MNNGTSGIVTLTTDFGTADGYVGAMKGYLLRHCSAVQILDLSHEIAPQDIAGAGWCLARAVAEFPKGTIHVAVIDPGVGSSRSALIGQHQGHWFVGPDNGLFARCWHPAGPDALYQLHRSTRWWERHHSFDGLHVFAPAAACLANGIPPEQLGLRTIHYERLDEPPPTPVIGGMEGQVIRFDRFGNAITNLEADLVHGFAKNLLWITCRGHDFALHGHYAECGGSGGAIINSDERLELCLFRGNAREALKLRIGDAVFLRIGDSL